MHLLVGRARGARARKARRAPLTRSAVNVG